MGFLITLKVNTKFQPPLPVSPLATFAFKRCVKGDTGLKTGWVSCRHVAGGGAGRGGGTTV